MHKEICQPGEQAHYPCCSQVNRFPDLKFKFYNDQLNNINVAEELCDKIRNKNVTFIGDSMERELVEGIFMILENTDKEIHYKDKFAIDFNHRCNGVVRYELSASASYIQRERLKYFTEISDIVLVNIGLHYDGWNIVDYILYVEAMAEVLSQSQKRAIIRNITPQHFDTQRGLHDKNRVAQMRFCKNETNRYSHPMNIVLKSITDRYRLGFMDEHVLLASTWDLHYRETDCTHFCHMSGLLYPQITVLL